MDDPYHEEPYEELLTPEFITSERDTLWMVEVLETDYHTIYHTFLIYHFIFPSIYPLIYISIKYNLLFSILSFFIYHFIVLCIIYRSVFSSFYLSCIISVVCFVLSVCCSVECILFVRVWMYFSFLLHCTNICVFCLREEKSTQIPMRWWSVSCVTLSPCSSTTTWSVTTQVAVRAPVAVVTAATGPMWTAGSEANADQEAHTTSCAVHAGKSIWLPTWALWTPNRIGDDEEIMSVL